MASRSVLVLGGDSEAATVAGRLAQDGHEVTVWEWRPLPQQSAAIAGERPRLRLSGVGGEAVVTLAPNTSDPFEALAAHDVLLTCSPPHAQASFADLVLPLIEHRHTLVVLPGGLGSLAFAKWLHDRGRRDLPTLAESDTVPFVGRWFPPYHVHVSALAADPGFGVFPACRTTAAMALLRDLFPGARAHRHVVAAALASVESFLRGLTLLLNVGSVDRPRTAFSPFEDGFTPSVAHVAETVDSERLALAGALGLDLPTAAETLHSWGLGPRGNLWSTVHGSLTLARAPDEISAFAQQLDDDVAFGMRPWVELAEQLSVRMPLTASLVALYDAAMGSDRSVTGRSLDDLGIDGMTATLLDRYLDVGEAEKGDESLTTDEPRVH